MALKDKSSPFVTISCKCPICGRESPHRYVKSKLYTPVETENDQHVIKYKWESPRFEGIRPNFYHIWHCPQCQFADEKEVFRGEDDSGGKLELIREKVLISSRAPYHFITRMGQVIDLVQEYIPLESALCAHLQAIYIQEMLSTNMRQYAKLGRFYLRTAWLFREKEAWNVPETNLPAEFKSYEAFFHSLKEEWPELPLNEKTALEQAIHYYQGDLDRSKRVDDVRHEITVLFLLIDLNIRVERLDDAVKLVRHAFQMATQKRSSTRHVLDGAISRGKGTAQQIESMRSLITWLNNAIERATGLSEKLNDLIFQREYPQARDLVLKMKGPDVQSVLKALREAGFHEVTCRRVGAIFNKKHLEKQTDASKPPETDPSEDQQGSNKGSGFWDNLRDKLGGS